jgi:hypothetical protein
MAARRPWQDQRFADELEGRLTPIALACADDLPYPNPIGMAKPAGRAG